MSTSTPPSIFDAGELRKLAQSVRGGMVCVDSDILLALLDERATMLARVEAAERDRDALREQLSCPRLPTAGFLERLSLSGMPLALMWRCGSRSGGATMADSIRRHRETVMRAMHPRSAPTHSEAWLESGGNPSAAPCWRVYNKLAQAIADTEAEALAQMSTLVVRIEAVRVAVERAKRDWNEGIGPIGALVNLIEELEKI